MSIDARIEATRLLLAQRGQTIPPDDLGDVLAAADDLSQAVADAAGSLSMLQIAEPFSVTMQQCARPPLPGSGALPSTCASAGQVRNSEDWVRDAISRIDTIAPGSLAWREVYADSALSRARQLDSERVQGHVRSPLHGMPVGLKDMLEQEGKVAGWGGILRAHLAPATQTATVVQRLEQAGVVVLGTQHMAEFAMSPTGFNANYGPGRNPWNGEHVSGGSSSGAGMSVGAGHVPLAIGSDTGGSVRLPSALCGVTGLKPTQHRISVAGAMPLSPSLDCLGPLGSSVQVVAWAYAAMAGADPLDPTCLSAQPIIPDWKVPASEFVVGVPRLAQGPALSADMLRVFDETVQLLKDLGVRCVEVPLPDLDLLGRLSSVMLASESAAIHRGWLTTQADRYGRQVRRRLSRGLLTGGVDYYDTLRLRTPLLKTFMEQTLGSVDVLMLPVAPDVAPSVANTVGTDERQLEKNFSLLSYWTRGINYLGVPALSVPAGVGAKGLPLGVQFIGAPLAEDRILALGHIFQQHTDWHMATSQRSAN